MAPALTIGRLAKAAGVNVETVRYYQRRGLIRLPPKPPHGHRRYPGEVVDQLGFIRRAQRFGFSLDEIKKLIRAAERRSFAKAQSIAEAQLVTLDQRIGHLTVLRDELKRLVAPGRRVARAGRSPFLDALLSGRKD